MNFTTNPSLVRVDAAGACVASSLPLTEPNITQILLEAGYTFAYLGRVDDPPRVTHIGEKRTREWLQ